MPYLEIEYRPSYWVHPLRTEIGRTPALATADRNWSSSGLLDLAFALETRIGNLTEIVRQVNENLRVLDEEFAGKGEELGSLVAGGYSYRVENEPSLRRTIIGLTSFVIEARACFENLAKFYKDFVRNYFGESVSLEGAYETVRDSVAAPGWSESLRLLRHDLIHDRSPWIRFQLGTGVAKYEPVLILEYRTDAALAAGDEVSLASLREMRQHLLSALARIRAELVERVKGLQ